MLFVQRDENYLSHCIASGVVAGRYKITEAKTTKAKSVTFTIVYGNDLKKDKYYTVEVIAYDKNAEQLVRYSKQTHTPLVVLGSYALNKAETERQGRQAYVIYANIVFSPSALAEMFDWHQSTKKFDEQMEALMQRSPNETRYDFETQERIEDHMI